MARYGYYSPNGSNKEDFRDIESDNIEVASDNGIVLVTISDDGGVKAIINLAPGEYIERRN